MENEKFAPPNDGEPEVEENLEEGIGIDAVGLDSTTIIAGPATGVSPAPLLVRQEQLELLDAEPPSGLS
mgnify:FL=1